MSEKQLKFLEFVPLILYITFVRSVDTNAEGPQWKISLFIGGALAIFTIAVLLRNRCILNRITLGVNLFLISGAMAVLFGLEKILDLYWRLNPAPMFAWVVTVGLATTLFSPFGFVGTRSHNPKRNRLYSTFLLAAAMVALGISLFFQGKIVYSDILPFIGLFMVNDKLRSRPGSQPI